MCWLSKYCAERRMVVALHVHVFAVVETASSCIASALYCACPGIPYSDPHEVLQMSACMCNILISFQCSVFLADCVLLAPLPVPLDVQLWALQPGKPAKQQQQAQQHSSGSTAAAAGAWKHGTSAFGGAGAMDGMMSSSSESESGDSSSSSDADSGSDAEGDGQRQPQFDSNNAVNNMGAPAAASRLQRQPDAARVQQRMQRRARQLQQQQRQLRLSAAWSVLEQQLAVLHGQQQGVLVLATCQLPAEALPHEMQQLFGCSDQQQQQCGSMSAASGDHYSSSGAMVQTCCCNVSGSSSVTTAAAAAAANAAALQCALDRAVAAAAEQYRQQLMFARDHQTLDADADRSNAGCTVDDDVASAHTQQAGGVAATAAPPEGASTLRTCLQQQELQQQKCTTAAAAAAAAAVPSASRRRPAGTTQQQQQQQLPVVSLQHLNAAQQAQAKHLFDQVGTCSQSYSAASEA
jgi:hypothetical protein